MLFLLGLHAIKKKIQNSPPKDIFKIFERKADNHSTLVIIALQITIVNDKCIVLN